MIAPNSSLKTRAHILARARNNQRRHRAKVREHIATLEARVRNLELLLEQAEEQNEELKKEIQQCRTREENQHSFRFADTTSENCTYHRLSRSSLPESNQDLENLVPQSRSFLRSLPQAAGAFPATGKLGEIISGDGPAADHIMNCKEGCLEYPKASTDESTTLCSIAYATVAQQNVRDVDEEVIHQWLSRGFRAAQRNGEGCRVANCVLLELLSAMDSWA